MNLLYVGHVAAFAVASVACFASIIRARRIQSTDTRIGLVSLFLTNGIWAGAHIGYLVLPSLPAKRAFYIIGLVAGLTAVGAWLYFCAAFTGRPPGQSPFRRVVVGILLAFILLKVTNPLHGLYFTATMATTPFDHLAITHGLVHWLAMGLSYSLAAVGFFMLFEHFHYAGIDTRPIAVLVVLTGVPVGFNVLGVTAPWLLSMTYEPIGVAVFSVGVMFVYFRRFETIHLAGEVDDPVIFLDQDDRISDFNLAARDLFPNLTGAVGEPLASTVPRLDANIESESGPFRIDRGDDTTYYQVSANPFMAGETRTGRSLVLTDVTETERYRRELERKTEQLEALNRVVRHDIRNDMTVVLGWGETLHDHVDGAGEDALDRLLRSATHVVELTKTAREFVDALAGEESPELTSIELPTKLDAEIETLRASYPAASITVPDDIPTVSVRASEMVSSVFRNILTNAVQHNDTESPQIEIDVKVRESTVVIRIADDGPGIPNDRKATVFGKGEKGLESEGTGIGLYLVKTLVDQFGGEVWVEDNQPRGATFVVELMRADVETQQ